MFDMFKKKKPSKGKTEDEKEKVSCMVISNKAELAYTLIHHLSGETNQLTAAALNSPELMVKKNIKVGSKEGELSLLACQNSEEKRLDAELYFQFQNIIILVYDSEESFHSTSDRLESLKAADLARNEKRIISVKYALNYQAEDDEVNEDHFIFCTENTEKFSLILQDRLIESYVQLNQIPIECINSAGVKPAKR